MPAPLLNPHKHESLAALTLAPVGFRHLLPSTRIQICMSLEPHHMLASAKQVSRAEGIVNHLPLVLLLPP
jgi:hypothetical protein